MEQRYLDEHTPDQRRVIVGPQGQSVSTLAIQRHIRHLFDTGDIGHDLQHLELHVPSHLTEPVNGHPKPGQMPLG